MELPIIIEPLPDQRGFAARLAALDLRTEAPTADEAQRRLEELLSDKLRNGLQLRVLHVGLAQPLARGGWLPDDELTQEWLRHIQEYRAECDEADRKELESMETGESSS